MENEISYSKVSEIQLDLSFFPSLGKKQTEDNIEGDSKIDFDLLHKLQIVKCKNEK